MKKSQDPERTTPELASLVDLRHQNQTIRHGPLTCRNWLLLQTADLPTWSPRAVLARAAAAYATTLRLPRLYSDWLDSFNNQRARAQCHDRRGLTSVWCVSVGADGGGGREGREEGGREGEREGRERGKGEREGRGRCVRWSLDVWTGEKMGTWAHTSRWTGQVSSALTSDKLANFSMQKCSREKFVAVF